MTPAITVTTITNKLHLPWSVAFLPDGKYLVTEKEPGTLRIVDKGTLARTAASCPGCGGFRRVRRLAPASPRPPPSPRVRVPERSVLALFR